MGILIEKEDTDPNMMEIHSKTIVIQKDHCPS